MANSSIITKLKSDIIKEFIKDDSIVQAIDSPTVRSTEKLIGTHIFDYHQNPNTLNTAITFLTIQVHIPQDYNYDDSYINSVLEIWIISHEKHMIVNNIPKIKVNRNDYLSILIDKKLNGSTKYGIGKLKLSSNIEGSFQQNYLFRKLTFTVKDLNNSLCEN